MRNKIFLRITFLLITNIILFSSNIIAGENDYVVIDEQFKKEYSEVPSFILFDLNNAPTFSELEELLYQYIEEPSKFELTLLREEADELGYIHYVYKQVYNNIPIEFSELRVHTKSGVIESMNGTLIHKAPLKNEIALTENSALEYALNFIGAEVYKWEIPEEEHLKLMDYDIDTYYPHGELTYVAPFAESNSEELRLAYKFNIYADQPLSRAEVYVDASNGEIIFINDLIHTINVPSTAHTGHSGVQNITTDSLGPTSFRLRQTVHGAGINTYNMRKGNRHANAVDFTNTSRVWNIANSNLDQYALDAHWGAEQTYLYFRTKYNRNSINGQGMALNSFVHYSANPPIGYANAFWDGQRMTYGDGGGNIKPLTALDIAGHEITHGLTAYTANLVYSRESGALNESFSDIFGTAIEHFGKPGAANWTIGENIGGVLRSLANPKAYRNPNTKGGVYWVNTDGCSPTQQNDNCGVHINSGVQNYWFYLLTNGGSGRNDINQNYNVQGIGIDAAAAIAFRTLTVYLGRTSDYDDARLFSIRSAIDLYGNCSPQAIAVQNAWHAVGVGDAFVPGVEANFTTNDLTNCKPPHQVRFKNLSRNAMTFQWSFGNGRTSAVEEPAHLYSAYGSYDVTLIADGGSCGKDTLVKTNYININDSTGCLVTLRPTNNTNQTDCKGILLDDGASVGPYSANQNSTIVIEPENAASITISFELFDIEDGSRANTCDNDYIEIYDGPSTSAALLGRFCNTNLPPATLTSSRGAITVRFVSNATVQLEGFRMKWECSMATAVPDVDFTTNVSTSCTGEVHFSDISTQGPTSWLWDFGDGNTSTEQNPVHHYVQNGSYNVKLTSTNTIGSNSVVKNNIVEIDRPTKPSVEDDTVCYNESATLKANANNIRWYKSEFGGSPISTSSEVTLDRVGKDTSLWVEKYSEGSSFSLGPDKTNPGVGTYFNGDEYLIFDVFSNMTLEAVHVISGRAGQRVVQLRNQNGVILQSKSVYLNTGFEKITLDFNIAPGTNYQLGVAIPPSSQNAPYLHRLTQGAQYPYKQDGVLSIKGSSTGTSEYFFFYNWEVREADCISPRAKVSAKIDTSCTNSLIELEQDKYNLVLYPNPAKDEFYISYDVTGKVESITLYNAQGAIVKEENIQRVAAGKYQMRTSDLARGVYFVNVKFPDATIRKRLIIIR